MLYSNKITFNYSNNTNKHTKQRNKVDAPLLETVLEKSCMSGVHQQTRVLDAPVFSLMTLD